MPRKLPKLRFVKYAKGGRYAFFNTGRKNASGNLIFLPLPDPATPEFHSSYAAYLAGRNRRAVQAYDVNAMADAYVNSAAFITELSANSQTLYRTQLKKVREFWGHFAVNTLEPSNVREVLDSMAWKAGTQASVLAVLGALYRWGRQNAKTIGEPTKDIKPPKGGSYEPWPDDVLEAGLESADPVVRLAVHLLYFTGLRIGDAVNLRWGQVKDGIITVKPQKTRKRKTAPLYIPVADELADLLDQTPRAALTILPPVNTAGLVLTKDRLRKDLEAFTKALGVETVPHGLRKNAVNALLLAGSSVAETAAITGQTYAVVEHYAAQINTKQLASAAIVKFNKARNKTGSGDDIGNLTTKPLKTNALT